MKILKFSRFFDETKGNHNGVNINWFLSSAVNSWSPICWRLWTTIFTS